MIRLSASFLILALVSVWTVPAADEPAQPIGPEEAIQIALDNHPMLHAADEEVRAAEADRQSAGSGYLPQIELTEDWIRSDNPVYVFSSKLLQGVFSPLGFRHPGPEQPGPHHQLADEAFDLPEHLECRPNEPVQEGSHGRDRGG